MNEYYQLKLCEKEPVIHVRHLGLISPTSLRAAFTPKAPKIVRIQLSCQYLFTLLGSTGAKAALRTLMKLTPEVVADLIKCFFFANEEFFYFLL